MMCPLCLPTSWLRKKWVNFSFKQLKKTSGEMDYSCHKSLMKSEKNYLSVVTNSDAVAVPSHISLGSIGNAAARVHGVQGHVG